MATRRTPATGANGHRRRQLVATIKATATHCALCGQPLNPDAAWPSLDCTVIDEDLPRSRGGLLRPGFCSACYAWANALAWCS